MSNITLDELNQKLDMILSKVDKDSKNNTTQTVNELDLIINKIEEYKKESIDPNFTQSLKNSLNEALYIKNQIKILSDKVEHNHSIYLENKKLLNNNLELNKIPQQIQPSSNIEIMKKVEKDKQNIENKIKKQENRKSKMEYKIGGELFGVLGAILILISLITLGKTLLPTFLQGIALFFIPVIVLLLGELCEKKISSKFSKILTAIGISSAYIATFINYLYMKNINNLTALILIVLITIGSLYISHKKQNLLIKIISLIGFYLALVAMCNMKTNSEVIIMSLCLLFISIIDIFVNIEDKKHIYDYLNLIFNIIISAAICMAVLSSKIMSVMGDMVKFDTIPLIISTVLIFTSFLIIIFRANKDRVFNIIAFIGLCIETAILSGFIGMFDHTLLEILSIGLVILPLAFAYIEKDKKSKWIYLYPTLIIWLPRFISNLNSDLYVINLFGLKYLFLIIVILGYMGILGRLNKERKIKVLNTISLLLIMTLGLLFEDIFAIPFMIISILLFMYVYKYESLSLLFIFFTIPGYIVNIIPSSLDISSFKIYGYCFEILVLIFAYLYTKEEKFKNEKTFQNIYILIAMSVIGFIFNFSGDLLLWTVSLISTLLFIYLINSENTKIENLDNNKLKIYSIITTLFIFLIPDVPGFLISILTILIAVISIYAGFIKIDKGLRLYGLILSLIMIIKLMLVDLYNIANMNKMILFFICGVLILSISFIYIKLEKKISKDN